MVAHGRSKSIGLKPRRPGLLEGTRLRQDEIRQLHGKVLNVSSRLTMCTGSVAANRWRILGSGKLLAICSTAERDSARRLSLHSSARSNCRAQKQGTVACGSSDTDRTAQGEQEVDTTAHDGKEEVR